MSIKGSRIILPATPAPVRANTGAVVVTYHPDVDIAGRLQQTVKQVDSLLIVDNSSSGAELSCLRDVAGEGKVELISNPHNLGVAAALNQGLRWARKRDYAWLLTMDQDSFLLEDAVRKIKAVYEQIDGRESVAVIGCNYIDKNTGKPHFDSRGCELRPWKLARTVISSGMLLSIPAACVLGDFLEDLFVYHVDCEYCLRARRAGLLVVRTREPLMEHIIGNPVDRHFLWWRKRLQDLSPERWYYHARNMVIISRLHWKSDPCWLTGLLSKRVRNVIDVLLYESDKLAKMRGIFLGLADGFRNKLGPCPYSFGI